VNGSIRFVIIAEGHQVGAKARVRVLRIMKFLSYLFGTVIKPSGIFNWLLSDSKKLMQSFGAILLTPAARRHLLLNPASTNVGGFRRFLECASCHFMSLSLDSCLFPFLARFLIFRFRCAGNLPPSSSGTGRSLQSAFSSF
jgi:hypothetical protein